MSRSEQYAYLASLFLLFGGLILAGAAAGVRVAMVDVVGMLQCTIGAPDCVAIVAELNGRMSTLLIGGTVAMACGGIGIWNIRRHANAESAETGNASVRD